MIRCSVDPVWAVGIGAAKLARYIILTPAPFYKVPIDLSNGELAFQLYTSYSVVQMTSEVIFRLLSCLIYLKGALASGVEHYVWGCQYTNSPGSSSIRRIFPSPDSLI